MLEYQIYIGLAWRVKEETWQLRFIRMFLFREDSYLILKFLLVRLYKGLKTIKKTKNNSLMIERITKNLLKNLKVQTNHC